MKFIKVWCEHDISGSFGGNHNEEVFAVSDDLSDSDINDIIEAKYSFELECAEYSYEEAVGFGFLGWEFISMVELKKESK